MNLSERRNAHAVLLKIPGEFFAYRTFDHCGVLVVRMMDDERRRCCACFESLALCLAELKMNILHGTDPMIIALPGFTASKGECCASPPPTQRPTPPSGRCGKQPNTSSRIAFSLCHGGPACFLIRRPHHGMYDYSVLPCIAPPAEHPAPLP